MSVFHFDELKDWVFNITQKTNIIESDDIYAVGLSGLLSTQTINRFIDIRLEKLLNYLYDIVITGSGTETTDTPFGVSVIRETMVAHQGHSKY